MKIVFFGASTFAPLVLPILEKNFEIEMVVNEKSTDSEAVMNSQSEIAVLAAFGKILPQVVLSHFKYGILNIHPSLLPKFRGSSPVQSAILAGETETGVSVIKLDAEMDHGPILAQEKIEVLPTDTTWSLYQKLFPLGAKLIVDNLEGYISGKKTLGEQNNEAATYTKPLTRESGQVEILNTEPDVFEREVRAYFPWPGVWSKVMITDKLLVIKFLPNNMVQVEGGKPMSYKDFLNGYPNADRNLVEFLRKEL
jgi:methionyl-tRNA formyltransferase